MDDAVDAWGNERDEYDFNNPQFTEQTGHFTQLVWKNTTTVGCGRKFCNGINSVSGWYVEIIEEDLGRDANACATQQVSRMRVLSSW